MSVRLACALLALALPLVVCTGAPKLAVDRLAREHSRSIARERSNVKIGIRRELSTVDLKKDLATPELPRPTEESTGAKGPPAAQTGRAPAVIRANSFTGPTPHIDPAELEPYQSRPKRGKSFCPPRRETSQADLADLSAPPRSPSRQAILRDPETAAAEQELKAEVLRTHGIVVGEVSREEEESWLSRIEYTGEVLGVGGFSVVHAAQDTKDQTIKYAVKVVKIPADNACFVRRLVREVLPTQHPPFSPLAPSIRAPACPPMQIQSPTCAQSAATRARQRAEHSEPGAAAARTRPSQHCQTAQGPGIPRHVPPLHGTLHGRRATRADGPHGI